MSTTSVARDRTSAAILEAATRLLAERGDASMADVADAAGVGRTTLYRHFPTRGALLDSMWRTAVVEAAERLADAGLEDCAVDEGIARALRALLAVGDRYIVLTRERFVGDRQVAERELGTPLVGLIERGQKAGVLRNEVEVLVLLEMFGGAIHAGIRLMSERGLGLEDASAHVTQLFLNGAAASSH
jgi:TetR/AcrR family transcriptional repressor of mexCD-oprJ operon